MIEMLEPRTMGKKMGRPTTDRDDVSAKIDRAIMSKAKLIAADRGVTAAQLLSELLAGPIDRAYAEMLRRLDAKGGSHGKGSV